MRLQKKKMENATHSRNISFDLSEERVSYEIFYFVNEKLLVRMCRLLVQVIIYMMHFNPEFRFFLVYETFCFVSQTGWEHSSQSYLTMDDDSEIMDEVISEHDEDDIDEDADPNDELNLSNSFIDGNVEDSTKRQ